MHLCKAIIANAQKSCSFYENILVGEGNFAPISFPTKFFQKRLNYLEIIVPLKSLHKRKNLEGEIRRDVNDAHTSILREKKLSHLIIFKKRQGKED